MATQTFFFHSQIINYFHLWTSKTFTGPLSLYGFRNTPLFYCQGGLTHPGFKLFLPLRGWYLP